LGTIPHKTIGPDRRQRYKDRELVYFFLLMTTHRRSKIVGPDNYLKNGLYKPYNQLKG